MKWYQVGGDYGPIAAMYYELFIYTSSPDRAIDIFAKRVERECPSMWERMGYRNVSVVGEYDGLPSAS